MLREGEQVEVNGRTGEVTVIENNQVWVIMDDNGAEEKFMIWDI